MCSRTLRLPTKPISLSQLYKLNLKQDQPTNNTRLNCLTSVPFDCGLEAIDGALFSAAVSEEAGGNETPSSTETVAGAWILDEVDGTSLDTQLASPTPEPLILIAGMDCEPAPEKL